MAIAECLPSDDPHAAEFAKFWDESDSEDRNIQVISWWLRYDGHIGRDPD